MNLLSLPDLPAHVVLSQQLIIVARTLSSSNKNPDLDRLCRIGGFVIRGIDLWTDVTNYKQELRKQRTNAVTKRAKSQVEEIHTYVLSYLCDSTSEKYFPNVNR